MKIKFAKRCSSQAMGFYPRERGFARSRLAPWQSRTSPCPELSCDGSLEGESRAPEPASEAQRGGEGQKGQQAKQNKSEL